MAARPAPRRRGRILFSLLLLFLISSIAIPLFYAAGLMYGQRSPLITAEYWRWWVVHLWVEGFFEVFATVVIAFLLTRLKLLSITTATRSVLFSTVIYLSGGIIGTFHHLYFTGAPNSVLALGAVAVAVLDVLFRCFGTRAAGGRGRQGDDARENEASSGSRHCVHYWRPASSLRASACPGCSASDFCADARAPLTFPLLS